MRSVTAAPAAQKTVTLTATPADDTTLTFASTNSAELGTKILSFYVYPAEFQISDTVNYVYSLMATANTDAYMVSSVDPAILNATYNYATDKVIRCLGGHWYSRTIGTPAHPVTSYYVYRILSSDDISLSYTGTNGDITISLSSNNIIFDTDNTYTGVFRVVDES